jgi:hypothetical protein
MAGPDLHPDIRPLAFLLGSWMGEGKGEYPTIAPFSYGEELRFWHVGKPFFAYTQRTWALDDGRPLHSESGYWRMAGPSRVELAMAHPTGVVEIEEGDLEGTTVTLATTAVVRTATAKLVERLERELRVNGDVLTYDVRMAALGQPLQNHLSGELQRGSG